MLAFVIVLAVLGLALKILTLVTSIFERILTMTIVLGIPSKILGAIVGMLEWFILAFACIYVLSMPMFNIKELESSTMAPKILDNTPVLSGVIRSTTDVINEFSLLKDKYSDKNIDTNEFNKETLDLFLKYNVVSVDSVCTSLNTNLGNDTKTDDWGSITAWGPTAMLPIFQLLGTNYTSYHIYSKINESGFDEFTKIDFLYRDAVASIKVGTGAKSEGELIISGTKGYAYVPAPWWKTDYFEIRYENPADNKRYFYQLDGEGIRYEMVDFLKTINGKISGRSIETSVTESIVKVIESFMKRKNLSEI